MIAGYIEENRAIHRIGEYGQPEAQEKSSVPGNVG